VPFVCAGPGVDGEELGSLAQLAPFIARAGGIEGAPWTEELPALAVAQFDPPGEGADDPRVIALAESSGLGRRGIGRLVDPLTSATDGVHKLVRRGDREELFDLGDDPLEEHPLGVADREEVIGPLRAALDHPAATASARPQAVREAPAGSAEELAKLEEQMKLLGYM
jgi:hypothetical protein